MKKVQLYMFLLMLLLGAFAPLSSACAGGSEWGGVCGSCPEDSPCGPSGYCGSPETTYGGGTNGSSNTEITEVKIDEGDSKDCALGEFLDSKSCVFCNLFKIMFNVASSLALTANNQLAIPSKNLVIIGFLIWMLFYFARQIGTMSATSTGEMLKGFLFQGFRVAVVVIILNGAIFQVMNLTLNPVMKTGFNFVNTLNSTSSCDKSQDYMQNIKGYEGNYAIGADGGLPVEIGESIICNIKNLEDATGVMIGLGKYSICLAHNKHRFLKNILPGLGYVSTGWVLWIVGSILMLAFPWCLIDCILQLCIAAALIPCAIAAYAFKITEKYVKIIWSFFMNAMFNFVFMALIIYIINSNLASWLGLSSLSPADVEAHDEIFVTGSLINIRRGISGMIGMDTGEMVGLAWWGIGAFKLMAICFFCWSFMDEAGSMAKRFADSPKLGGSEGIGRMVGGTMVQGFTNYAMQPAAHYTAEGAKALGNKANAAFGNSLRSNYNRMTGMALSGLSKFGISNNQIIRDPITGDIVGYHNTMRALGKDIERTVTRDANGVWTSMQNSRERTATDKAFEMMKDENGEPLRDENGNIRYQSRQRTLGMVTGYEEMTATKDEEGFTHYSTADGSRTFTMNPEGEIVSYKTPYTRTLLNQGQEIAAPKAQGMTQTVNDGVSSTTNQYDAQGNLVSSKTDFKNASADKLVKTDGTLNAQAFNQMKNNAANPESAATYMVSEVMESRGLALPNTFTNRDVKINEDGSFTIIQNNQEGVDKATGQAQMTQRIINAKIVGKQMVIDMKTVDSKGNITHHKSNGIQTAVNRYTVKRDNKGNVVLGADGKPVYDRDSKFSFSDYTNQQNKGRQPLDAQGRWGNNINREQAMAGFTQEDYDRHLAQIQLDQLQRTTRAKKFAEALNTENSQISNLHEMLHQSSMSEDDVRAATFQVSGISASRQPAEDYVEAELGGSGDNGERSPIQQVMESEERARQEEQERRQAAEEKARQEEEQRQKDAEERAIQEEHQRQQQQAEMEEQQRLHNEHIEHENERVALERERDEITKQYAEITAQLESAREAVNTVGLTDAQKRQAQATYDELLRQSSQLQETLKANRRASNEAIGDYNSRVEKHNSELH